MAATGKTPILLYGSTTVTNTPSAGNLTNSSDGCEIAINVADKNLFFKDSSNVVNTVPIRQSSASSNGWLSSTDWSTFNGKQTAYTNLTSIGGLANATGWLYNNGSGTFSYSTPSASDVGAVPTSRTVSTTSPLAGGGALSSNLTLSITQATTSTNGYLSSTDWNTFNNKQPAGTYVTSVTGTAPVVSSGGTTPAISMAAATTSVNGYLTSTDWTTFNGKQAALVSGTNIKTVNGTTLLGSGDLGTINVGYGGTGLTSVTAGNIPYGSTASALASNIYFTWDAANYRLGVNKSGPAAKVDVGNNEDIPSCLLYTTKNNGGSANALSIFDDRGYSGVNSGNTIYARSWSTGDDTGNLLKLDRYDGTINTAFQVSLNGGVSIGNTTDPGATNLSVTGKGLFTGSVGVGVSPVLKFQVSPAANISLGINNATVVSGAITLEAINDARSVNIPMDFRASAFYMSTGLTSGAGTNAVKFNTGTGQLTYDTSSEKYKDNIRDSIYGLDDVMKIRSVQFEYKDDGRSDVGLIAEELHPIIPELVGLDKDGNPDSVSYDRLVSVLIKAVQELNAKIESLIGQPTK